MSSERDSVVWEIRRLSRSEDIIWEAHCQSSRLQIWSATCFNAMIILQRPIYKLYLNNYLSRLELWIKNINYMMMYSSVVAGQGAALTPPYLLCRDQCVQKYCVNRWVIGLQQSRGRGWKYKQSTTWNDKEVCYHCPQRMFYDWQGYTERIFWWCSFRVLQGSKANWETWLSFRILKLIADLYQNGWESNGAVLRFSHPFLLLGGTRALCWVGQDDLSNFARRERRCKCIICVQTGDLNKES